MFQAVALVTQREALPLSPGLIMQKGWASSGPKQSAPELRIKARPLEPSDPTCQASGSAPGGKANRAKVKNLSVFRVQQTARLLPSRSAAAPASHLPSWHGFIPLLLLAGGEIYCTPLSLKSQTELEPCG